MHFLFFLFTDGKEMEIPENCIKYNTEEKNGINVLTCTVNIKIPKGGARPNHGTSVMEKITVFGFKWVTERGAQLGIGQTEPIEVNYLHAECR